MRAVVTYKHGGLDQMIFEPDYRNPILRPTDVILRVRACTLNYHDVFTRKGMPGIKIPMPIILGIDVSGEVKAVGAEVEGIVVGERVLVDPIDRVDGGLLGETFDGGLAELVRVPAHMIIPLPDDISFADAAALPTAYGTAYRMMMARPCEAGRESADTRCFRRCRNLLCSTGEAGGCNCHCLRIQR